MRKSWLAAALLGLSCVGLRAQAPVVTQPQGVTSFDASSTIATTDTFQLVWDVPAQGRKRMGCLVLNNSTHRQWVYFGTTPTKGTSVPMEPATVDNGLGGYVSCSAGGGVVLQDQVWITGTTGDSYVAKQQ